MHSKLCQLRVLGHIFINPRVIPRRFTTTKGSVTEPIIQLLLFISESIGGSTEYGFEHAAPVEGTAAERLASG